MGYAYRLKANLIGLVSTQSDQPAFKQLCAGDIIRLVETPRGSGLVNATTMSGETITVFYSDLEDRGEKVASAE